MIRPTLKPKLTGLRSFLARAVKTFRTGERPRKVEILPPLVARRLVQLPRHANAERGAEVVKILNCAPSGLTYDELQKHVRDVTGTACSRKVVARWKKEQSNSSASSHYAA